MRRVDLSEAVKTRARVDGDLVMVDEFLNHRVEPELMASLGRDLSRLLADRAPTLLLTAEASGIPVTLAASTEMAVPMVYAKKYLGPGSRYAFAREVASPTRGIEYRVEVSRRVLEPGSRVAIIDDFLSGGRTAEALGLIAEEAGCDVVACAFAIEKVFASGRARLEAHRWPVFAVVRVGSVHNGTIELV